MIVNERYTPTVVGVDSQVAINSTSVGGFLALTSGTITITRNSSAGPFITALPVTAGTYTPIPFYIGGGTITTADGASGILGTC